MRRTFVTLTVAALALVTVLPLQAAAGAQQQSAEAHLTHAQAHRWRTFDRVRPDVRPQAVERLTLRCEALPRARSAACAWSPSEHSGFAAYRVIRGVPGSHREVVFRTGHVHQTRHLDGRLRPRQVYVYWVQAVDRHGRMIGLSNPVRVALR